jgi:hypothetical protein
MDNLELRVARLEELPTRVDALTSQVSQLRDEMRVEFSTVRDEIRAGDEETRQSLRDEIRAGDEETRRSLRDEIRAGDEETRRVLREEVQVTSREVMAQVRLLHEDQKATLALLSEGRRARRKPRPDQ